MMKLFWTTIAIMVYRPYRFFYDCHYRHGLFKKQRDAWEMLYIKACRKMIGDKTCGDNSEELN